MLDPFHLQRAHDTSLQYQTSNINVQIGFIINFRRSIVLCLKTQTFTLNKFVSIHKYEKDLAQTDTLSNIQNNYIKTSDFRHDITRLLLYREILRNISCLGKVLQPILLSISYYQSHILLHFFFLYYCRGNKTGNEIFFKQTKI